MDEWVRKEYRERFCDNNGQPNKKVNLDSLRHRLNEQRPDQAPDIRDALKTLNLEICVDLCRDLERDEQGRFKDPSAAHAKLSKCRTDLYSEGQRNKVLNQIQKEDAWRFQKTAWTVPSVITRLQPSVDTSTPQSVPPLTNAPLSLSVEPSRSFAVSKDTNGVRAQEGIDQSDDAHLARQSSDYQNSEQSVSASATDSGSESSSDDQIVNNPTTSSSKPNFSLIDQLNPANGRAAGTASAFNGIHRDVGHAPLLSGEIVSAHAEDLVPQYGFLGLYTKSSDTTGTRIFQNTNVPFSTFICGVQGSGKSHTTAVMLENAILPSAHLGHLVAPISALVFSYGEFSNGGQGFNVSEVASLAVAKKAFPGHQIKNITVLTSSSNPAIERLYGQLANVKVIPFKLKSKALDIGALLALMAVDEKSAVPLYMARVESILRAIATENKAGVFDYNLFKKRLALEKFDPTQTNMLEMRLNLLESFLDNTNKSPEPKFRQGEITIVDLSDPFVKPHTACILFKLCLERFMQSRAPGKMVVLDEAHKYMLDNPGSKVLTEYLKTLTRLERHKGARIIISTQEPTVSTDLIALCSVTVIHRFTSPAWYVALKKHIHAMENDEATMEQIEALKTGEALIYSPNTVLGKNENGTLRKATGRLLKLNIRMRVTSDRGESVMAI
ncbi:Nn.00g083140.m01.CDS01 [Neocucurbitaria sp. VM-36]